MPFTQIVPDCAFDRFVAGRVDAVLHAFGAIQPSAFLRGQIKAEITEAIVCERGIAPESSCEPDADEAKPEESDEAEFLEDPHGHRSESEARFIDEEEDRNPSGVIR